MIDNYRTAPVPLLTVLRVLAARRVPNAVEGATLLVHYSDGTDDRFQLRAGGLRKRWAIGIAKKVGFPSRLYWSP